MSIISDKSLINEAKAFLSNENSAHQAKAASVHQAVEWTFRRHRLYSPTRFRMVCKKIEQESNQATVQKSEPVRFNRAARNYLARADIHG
jgi:hypothetical protein